MAIKKKTYQKKLCGNSTAKHVNIYTQFTNITIPMETYAYAVNNKSTKDAMSLVDYVYTYARVPCQSGVNDAYTQMTRNVITTILTQHCASKGIKKLEQSMIIALLK